MTNVANDDHQTRSLLADGERIRFSLPFVGLREQRALASALQGATLHGDGPIGKRVEGQLREWLEIDHVLLTTSCTHALEMAMTVLGIGPGDEVIMPSFNFVSSANAVVGRGATPVFADIRPETMNIDPEDVERKITQHTKAIVPVHYAGIGCEMDTLMSLAEAYHLHVVEDAAQCLDSAYRGQALGTIGDIGCYSFHSTKNITCGEGGAFLTNNEELANRAEIVREKGTNRSAFTRGEVRKYSWVGEGSSYVLSDILAALLEVQLDRRGEIRTKRKAVWETYYQVLAPLEEEGHLELPVVPPACRQNYHIFYFRVATPALRDQLIRALQQHGIEATFHYVPLHASPYGQRFDCDELPNTLRCSETLIRLPVYPQLAAHIDTIARRVAGIVEETVPVSIAA